jgi:hypothetical protein
VVITEAALPLAGAFAWVLDAEDGAELDAEPELSDPPHAAANAASAAAERPSPRVEENFRVPRRVMGLSLACLSDVRARHLVATRLHLSIRDSYTIFSKRKSEANHGRCREQESRAARTPLTCPGGRG